MRTASIQWEVWEARLERERKVSGEDRTLKTWDLLKIRLHLGALFEKSRHTFIWKH